MLRGWSAGVVTLMLGMAVQASGQADRKLASSGHNICGAELT